MTTTATKAAAVDISNGFIVAIDDTLHGRTQRIFTPSLGEAKRKAERLIQTMASANVAVLEVTNGDQETIIWYDQTDWH